MLVFPNCKINLGLHVVNKRPDGYHHIETVFYPVNWCDALEIIEHGNLNEPFLLEQSGISINGPQEQNLIFKAWQLISSVKKCPPIKVHLHKNIPMGAGLGGGSADAAFFITAMDAKFHLGLSATEKHSLAAQLGSDCAFFINNRPVFATGKGDEFTDLGIDLSAYYILLVFPAIHSNTKAAYQGLAPQQPACKLPALLTEKPVSEWKPFLVNDFEPSIFKQYPEIKALKETLYAAGALYASMSGSGSAVFGIFEREPSVTLPANYRHCLQKPAGNVL